MYLFRHVFLSIKINILIDVDVFRSFSIVMLINMALILLSFVATALAVRDVSFEPRLDNGLALTPVMG